MRSKDGSPSEGLAREMRAAGLVDFSVAAVLGSGLGAFAERLENPVRVPFERLTGMAKSSVDGHAGVFVCGDLGGERVLLQQGRLHLYEGHDGFAVTRSVRAMARLGARALLLTNAAGGLNPDWPVPSLMRITDHLNLQGRAPLWRGEAGLGPVYDREGGEVMDGAARELDLELRKGVYAGMLGPSYETPAEIRMLSTMGAQAVGMSTVAEAVCGAALGLRVVGLSLISNPAAGMAPGPLSHGEVTQAGRDYAQPFERLLELGLPRLARLSPGEPVDRLG